MKKIKKIPSFQSEDEEREFWATQSPLDYVNHSRRIILNDIVDLTPKYISIRVPPKMIAELKTIAKEMDIAYQALIKIWLHERLKQEKNIGST